MDDTDRAENIESLRKVYEATLPVLDAAVKACETECGIRSERRTARRDEFRRSLASMSDEQRSSTPPLEYDEHEQNPTMEHPLFVERAACELVTRAAATAYLEAMLADLEHRAGVEAFDDAAAVIDKSSFRTFEGRDAAVLALAMRYLAGRESRTAEAAGVIRSSVRIPR